MDPSIRTRLHNACVYVWCACVCVYMHLCLLRIFCMLNNNDMMNSNMVVSRAFSENYIVYIDVVLQSQYSNGCLGESFVNHIHIQCHGFIIIVLL